MEFVKTTHEGVDRRGNVEGGGAVVVDGSVRMGQGEGCGLDNCHCSDGHWLTICLPRDSWGKVEVVTVYLTKREMSTFMKHHCVNG